jgi:hypothetical protein
MKNSFIEHLMSKLNFPNEAKETFSAVEQKIISVQKEQIIEDLVNTYMQKHPEITELLPQLDALAESLHLSNYTIHLWFLLICTPILFERYLEKNIPEQIFWDSMQDLKCKLIECHEVKGVWGVFTITWYPRFFDMTRFALGRFQYEPIAFAYDSYEKNGFSVKKGDTVYNCHIPSCGSMPKEIRHDSYRRAYEFFKNELNGKPIVIVCHSWLLYPAHKSFLPEHLNIIGFMNDFDIIHSVEKDSFSDIWRVFGKDHALPLDQLPTNTTLRKAYAERLISGGKTGEGFGVLGFDGERIL